MESNGILAVFTELSPNLYVKIYIDGEQIGRTRTMKRTMTPKWDGHVPM
jgi:Ca2+-dependent lipid-binding protein